MERVGDYELLKKLGEGGMGVVYEAEQKTLGRKVALKVLHDDFSKNRDAVSRFFDEAKAAAAVDHPGVVTVHEFGYARSGKAFLAMELLAGETLKARIEARKKLSEAEVLALVRKLTRVLHAVHQEGIVHRDLKPENVFIVSDNEARDGERVKLLDFGIAKLVTKPKSRDAMNRPGFSRGCFS